MSSLSDPNIGNQRFIFLSLSSAKVSRTRNYYRGIQSRNVEVRWIDTSFIDLCKSLLRKDSVTINGENDVITVCSPSHILVLPLVFFLDEDEYLEKKIKAKPEYAKVSKLLSHHFLR